jgi:GMP synthase-like glutamine amidotransferase
MSKAVVLQHAPHEGPGRIVPVFRDFGIPVDVRHLYKGDEVPTDLDELRVLIVLGGPMGVADVGNEKYPYLAKEVELLQRLIKRDRPVLAICLGAQLLAHAAGSKVYPNVKMGKPEAPGHPPKPVEPIEPLPEFGWLPVTFPFPGGAEPMVFGLTDGVEMFHWHYDTFDLPAARADPCRPAARATAASGQCLAQQQQVVQEPGLSVQEPPVWLPVPCRIHSGRHRSSLGRWEGGHPQGAGTGRRVKDPPGHRQVLPALCPPR